ncbi:protein kinase [Streptomyces sp. MBT65]|uniref:serine/threonine-protein kinase n=1 Tax=Streptomyces sp. MBT65 TaxID=1488395 RepID=UPI00190AD72F|nr:serine/threonine-protein kinase [Streptomyces sp. MBT65]MBK3576366.1 protein kinase [Streptomyces sp. MBT65]
MSPDLATNEAAALRQTGASPLRLGDPDRIGPYVPLALLGSGGMGRVYLARPADGGPGLAAVKVIRPEYADDPGFRRRFEREASVHERVSTSHTPRLCGTGFQHELLWMATEYLPGLDLAHAVRELGALETAAVWRLVAELGQALADLAVTGIVHRDLKPSNVLLSVGGAHVIDFGISKAMDASTITGTGVRVGTPAYMSPEHLRTGRSDTASDVFSLAGTLVYAAAGRAPFGDGTGVDVMHRVAFEEPDPELIAEISAADAELGSLLTACLAKEPERRPTGQDLIAAAGERGETTVWPEPLAGQLLARQRAYEVLYRIPVASQAPLRSADERPPAVPSAPAGQGGRPGPPPLEPPVVAADAASGTPSARPQESKVRTWARRTSVRAVAVGIAVCAVAAAGFMLSRQDPPPAASAPGSATTTGRTVPGGTVSSPVPGASDVRAASGKSVDGAANPNGASTNPGDSGSAAPGVHGTPSAPDADPSASAAATPSSSPSSPPTTEPATPAWISDCTYYNGNGRTRLGQSGKRVLQVQCMLTKRGYDVGGTGVDGDFGAGTESAVRSFQSDKLLDADGIVGHETWLALRSTE